jgi:RNA polymerase sigma-70 factor (ECF subfamily)
MPIILDDPTSPSMLARVKTLSNQPAWAEFVRYYDPRLRRWCRRFALDGNLADDLCQRIWIELMRRMPTFRYDPTRSFRGWLWFLFRSRAINLMDERRGELAGLVDAAVLDDRLSWEDDLEDEPDERVLALLREGEAIHENVKGRVKPNRWEAYWRIIVQREAIAETAALLGMTYVAAYRAAHYVDGMVQAEVRRRKDGTTLHD